VRPAAYCGCIGFKPSFGRIPRDGVLEFSATLDHVGLFTRSVHDATVLFSACADPNEHSAAPLGRAPRLTAVRSPVWDSAAPYAQEHFMRTLARLREAGASIEERELPQPFADARPVHRTIMFGEGARSFAALRQLHARVLSAPTLSMIDEGLGISEEQLCAARAERLRLRDALDEIVASTDALVTPPATGEAPDMLTTGNPRFCTIWTLCGVPALTLPSGRGPSGLPLGTQLIGRFGRDADLLEVARWCETALADR
jgi:Asp-tRNA(Asn)/Glu-tRNA(Gln) amidotransferase A subunit family amidase